MKKIILIIVLGVVFTILWFPSKDFFICQDKWSPFKTSLEIKSYFFGFKMTINDYSLLKCDTTPSSISCSDEVNIDTFNRVDGDYDVITKNLIRFYSCEKVDRKI